ncbi:MAG: hypothetical protein BWY70_01346 [Bacteroidetes bacterium ADurb.Bin408]|nr:MAG: hypothetical protein BWY70_01346 [Bacteroidetes bacterium ADurb.Bin408]
MFLFVRKFVVLVVAALLLLAYTGLNITKHTCISCKKTFYYIISHTDCCSFHYKTHTSQNKHCCNTPVHTQEKKNTDDGCYDKGCCHSENIYLKVSNVFTVNPFTQIAKALVSLVFELRQLLTTVPLSQTQDISSLFYRPPPPPDAKQIIILFHRLIFYA